MAASSLGRKQRKALYNLPWHQRRKHLGVHLDGKLIEKYHVRSISVRKGDTVKVLRGKHGETGVVGLEAKVARVDIKDMKIIVEGGTISKADGKQKEREIDPSNVLLTKLDLSDPKRRRRIERKGKLAEGELKEEAEAAAAEKESEKKLEEEKKEVKKSKKAAEGADESKDDDKDGDSEGRDTSDDAGHGKDETDKTGEKDDDLTDDDDKDDDDEAQEGGKSGSDSR